MPTFYSPQYARWLLGLYWLQWVVWAYRPPFFQEWLLENVLPFLFVGLLIATYRRFPLSNISYSLIFVFMCLHTVGAHYTYSLVPYHRWSQNFLGLGVNDLAGFQRNHYDRNRRPYPVLGRKPHRLTCDDLHCLGHPTNDQRTKKQCKRGA